jgi:hypothetical protein
MLLRNPKMPLPRNTLEKEGVQCKDLTDIKAWNCVMGWKRSQYTKGPLQPRKDQCAHAGSIST